MISEASGIADVHQRGPAVTRRALCGRTLSPLSPRSIAVLKFLFALAIIGAAGYGIGYAISAASNLSGKLTWAGKTKVSDHQFGLLAGGFAGLLFTAYEFCCPASCRGRFPRLTAPSHQAARQQTGNPIRSVSESPVGTNSVQPNNSEQEDPVPSEVRFHAEKVVYVATELERNGLLPVQGSINYTQKEGPVVTYTD